MIAIPNEVGNPHGFNNQRMHRFRLATSIPGPVDGTSLVRGMGPLTAMSKQDRRLELVMPPQSPKGWDLNWAWIASCDALFLQRPFQAHEAQAAVMAKMMGKPVWVDWDDDLMCVPSHNPKQHLYDPKQVGPSLAHLVNLADFVTVSTKEIQGRRNEMLQTKGDLKPNGKIKIVPNACMWPLSEGPRERRITWRGASNHDADVIDFLAPMEELSTLPQHSRWKWTFIGDPGWQVEERIPEANFELDYGGDAFLYMRIFRELAPYVHIVPLRNDAFNRCRSNLAWIEATAAGAVVIAPDWPEWHRPGIINYTDAQCFKRELRGVMETFAIGESKAGRAEHSNVAMSREWIKQNIMLELVRLNKELKTKALGLILKFL